MLQLVLHVEGHGEARAALQLTNMGKVTKHETFFFGTIQVQDIKSSTGVKGVIANQTNKQTKPTKFFSCVFYCLFSVNS